MHGIRLNVGFGLAGRNPFPIWLTVGKRTPVPRECALVPALFSNRAIGQLRLGASLA